MNEDNVDIMTWITAIGILAMWLVAALYLSGII